MKSPDRVFQFDSEPSTAFLWKSVSNQCSQREHTSLNENITRWCQKAWPKTKTRGIWCHSPKIRISALKWNGTELTLLVVNLVGCCLFLCYVLKTRSFGSVLPGVGWSLIHCLFFLKTLQELQLHKVLKKRKMAKFTKIALNAYGL